MAEPGMKGLKNDSGQAFVPGSWMVPDQIRSGCF